LVPSSRALDLIRLRAQAWNQVYPHAPALLRTPSQKRVPALLLWMCVFITAVPSTKLFGCCSVSRKASSEMKLFLHPVRQPRTSETCSSPGGASKGREQTSHLANFVFTYDPQVAALLAKGGSMDNEMRNRVPVGVPLLFFFSNRVPLVFRVPLLQQGPDGGTSAAFLFQQGTSGIQPGGKHVYPKQKLV